MPATTTTATGDHEPSWLKAEGNEPLLAPKTAGEAKENVEAGGSDRRKGAAASSKRRRGGDQSSRRRRITKPFFVVLGTLTALASLAAVATNAYVLVADGEQEAETEETADRIILRGFGVVLALLGVLTELNLKWWRRAAPILDYSFARGFLHALVAFLTLSEFDHWSNPANVVGLILACSAGLYLCAGVCVRRHIEVDNK